MNAWVLSGFGLNVAMIAMALAWAVARRAKNARCLDVASSVLLAVIACFYAVIGAGDPLRKWLIASMVTVSSLRLASLLLLDVIRNHPHEGQRYQALREHFPQRPWLMLFGFSEYLAALITLLLVPLAIACSNSASGLRGVEIAASIVWLAAIAGETVAKEPFRRFLGHRSTPAPTRDPNLARYTLRSRYFPEWLSWFAYFLFALGSPWGWTTFYCPLIMFYSLTTANALLPRPPAGDLESELKESRNA
jgi:steroid 5-alpha reductase family enzyme